MRMEWGGYIGAGAVGAMLARRAILRRVLTDAARHAGRELPSKEFTHRLDVDRMPVIGTGSIVSVYEDCIDASGTAVAVKGTGGRGLYFAWQFRREVEMMAVCQGHRSVPQLIGVHYPTHGDGGYLLVYRKFEGRPMNEIIKDGSYDLSQASKLNLMRQLVWAMAYVHGKNVMHRDLKSHNVVVDAKGRIGLIDYGSATFIAGRGPRSLAAFVAWAWWRAQRVYCLVSAAVLSRGSASLQRGGVDQAMMRSVAARTREIGTDSWIAPEVWTGVYDEKCDVYSFAMVLYELVARREPWTSVDALRLPTLLQTQRPRLPPDHAGDIFISVIHRCWVHDACERPSFAELKAQIREAEAAFKQCDHDLDGRVSLEEFSTAFKCKESRRHFKRLSREADSPTGLTIAQFHHLFTVLKENDIEPIEDQTP
eukprot:TRINITY_DN5489_c0_g1_i1.p1 TRINITY_DN5489_c0_g1~~TRINITY_DN5489_c0_g1_i1.p1  ORF type:complete len:424 (+),score=119.09 TRINITY_DN5489_c0_g1_i1:119-1390(+)